MSDISTWSSLMRLGGYLRKPHTVPLVLRRLRHPSLNPGCPPSPGPTNARGVFPSRNPAAVRRRRRFRIKKVEEEMEEITRAKRRLAKKREGDGKEEEDDDDDDEQEQEEKDQQEEEEDLKVRDFLTLFIFTLCNSSFDS
ncbi:hypothetical protein ILYODFUR_035181 [Ilyodon furcidens]|uniref:Uncharacterized protein n=1 Tax=Ilyodon furcidens TaxID=33524 RepID=A0ABV0V8R0_9TELE